jgi:hypothetical protein
MIHHVAAKLIRCELDKLLCRFVQSSVAETDKRRKIMKNFKTVLIGFVLVGCFLMTGCGSDNGDGGYRIAEYYPLGQGDTWLYGWNQLSAKTYEGMYTRTISGTETIDNVEAVKLQMSSGGYYLFTNTNGLTRYKDGIEAEYQRLFSPPLQEYPARMSVGEQHTFSSDVTVTNAEGNSFAANISITVTLEGSEEVTVPAGTFPSSLKLKGTWTYIFYNGNSTICEYTEWLAKQVGFVKVDQQCRDTDAETGAIDSFGYIDELVSATVGGVSYSDSSAKGMDAAQPSASSVPPGFARSRRR